MLLNQLLSKMEAPRSALTIGLYSMFFGIFLQNNHYCSMLPYLMIKTLHHQLRMQHHYLHNQLPLLVCVKGLLEYP